MDLLAIRTQVRQWLRDINSPQEWSDATLNRYINSAIRESVFRSRPIKQIDTIGIASGTSQYELGDMNILYVESIVMGSQPSILLTQFSNEIWTEYCYSTHDRSAVGTPSQYALDGGTSEDGYYCSPISLDLWPIPNADDVATVRFFAKPEELCNDTDVPCLGDAEDHFKIAHWAAHLAFMEHDTDVYNPGAAVYHRQEFESYFGRRLSAYDRNIRQRGIPEAVQVI